MVQYRQSFRKQGAKLAEKAQKNVRSYAELSAELEVVLAWFESEEIDIDKAAEQYKKARELISAIEQQLEHTENTIEKIKNRFDKL